MKQLNWAGIITYGPWPHGTDREEWVHALPSHWDGHEILDVLRVYDPIESPRVMRRGDIDAYIRAHAPPAQPDVIVPPGYGGRTDLNQAMLRLRSFGGDFQVEQDGSRDVLSVGYTRPGPQGMAEIVDVARLPIESTGVIATVDTEELEAALADLTQQTATPAYI